MFSADQ
jgi:hypothetical protein